MDHADRDLALRCLSKWSCEAVGEPVYTRASLLWPAIRAGSNVMLKIADPNDDEAFSAEALEFFDGHGAVKLLEHDRHVLLMERVPLTNDHDLERMVLEGQDDEATRTICEVISKLHTASKARRPPKTSIPFQQRILGLSNNSSELPDAPMLQLANEIWAELREQTAESEIFLHGDIHHFNVLHSAERGWLAIDPKGIRGPRIYEYVNSLCNPYNHESIVANVARMKRQASIISEITNFDKRVLLRFAFVHAMLAAAWSVHQPNYGYWIACAKTAAKSADFKLSTRFPKRGANQPSFAPNEFPSLARAVEEAYSTPTMTITYDPKYRTAFRDLNLAWIKKYFRVEPKDLEQTSAPEECLEQGGEIFFILVNGEAAGTCAMYKTGEGIYELAKMAVDPSYQGRGFGDQLMLAAEEWARRQGAREIHILSNTILTPAITLYKKHGYETVHEGPHPDYERCNIEMKKVLK